jgi:hypothetical protein
LGVGLEEIKKERGTIAGYRRGDGAVRKTG